MSRHFSILESISSDGHSWSGLRKPQRHRLAHAVRHLINTGSLNRADIMRDGEVSQPQASLDLRTIRERQPGLMIYDASAKHYKLSPAAQRLVNG